MIIAVNEDIQPENLDMLFWAMSYRMRPHQDLRILDHKIWGTGHAPVRMTIITRRTIRLC